MAENTRAIEALESLEKLFTARTVVGEPFQVDGVTIVPLLAVGMGFGAGSGSSDGGKNPGSGDGFGGGGGVRPVALIISSKDGLRVERLTGATPSMVESIADAVRRVRSGEAKTEPKLTAP